MGTHDNDPVDNAMKNALGQPIENPVEKEEEREKKEREKARLSSPLLSAILRAGEKARELLDLDLPSVKSIEDIRERRVKEWELEKVAPSTGYEDLDDLIRGFIPGHVYVLTGETNVGKTATASNFAIRVALQNKRVLYIALEPENTIIDYLSSVYWDKRFDELTEEDLLLPDLPIDILGKEDVDTTEKLVEVIEAFDRYDLVVVDHVGYFIKSTKNTVQEQSNMMKAFAGIAKANKTAILLIAHLRKKMATERKQKTPTADDISGSASFKQDATDVLIVTRDKATDDPEDPRYANTGRLYVAKTKSGQNGMIRVYFSERKAKIVSEREALKNAGAEEKEDTIVIY